MGPSPTQSHPYIGSTKLVDQIRKNANSVLVRMRGDVSDKSRLKPVFLKELLTLLVQGGFLQREQKSFDQQVQVLFVFACARCRLCLRARARAVMWGNFLFCTGKNSPASQSLNI